VGATADISTQVDFTSTRLGPLMRLRADHKFAEKGFGADVCGRPYPFRWAICGRGMALESGHFDGEFAVGVLSPRVGIQLWMRHRQAGAISEELPLGHRHRRQQHLGRPPLHRSRRTRLNSWVGTTPHLALTFGRATHERRHRREPEPVEPVPKVLEVPETPEIHEEHPQHAEVDTGLY
jgi:hypothetical protein